jgi:hypothetical protein
VDHLSRRALIPMKIQLMRQGMVAETSAQPINGRLDSYGQGGRTVSRVQ